MNDSTWTWISGNVISNNVGIYDEKGHPNTSNIPGGRTFTSGWFDCSSKELWVFGGQGIEGFGAKEAGTMEGVCRLLTQQEKL